MLSFQSILYLPIPKQTEKKIGIFRILLINTNYLNRKYSDKVHIITPYYGINLSRKIKSTVF